MGDMGIEELREQYKMEKDADIRERILMIIWLKSGKSTYEIGDLLFCPHSRVAYWKKRFNSGGLEGLRTAERPGRLGSIDDRTGKRSVPNYQAAITGRPRRSPGSFRRDLA